jgi:glycosyltransferase involved in cell wall biosynthesis
MRILMLGWEFPPVITGGLGIACHGLTRALDQLGHTIRFVLPAPIVRSEGAGVLDADGREPLRDSFEHTSFLSIPAMFGHPYQPSASLGGSTMLRVSASDTGAPKYRGEGQAERFPAYGNDLHADADRYAQNVLSAVGEDACFDVVHAHDWLTFPAGIALAEKLGRPLVVHIHSTEYDRSPTAPDPRIVEIEREGVRRARRVICVSRHTKNAVAARYGIDPAKIDVVHNGVSVPAVRQRRVETGEGRIVLFLGRLTEQKGPGQFLRAAPRVLERVPEALFVVAGSGDLSSQLAELAEELGIAERVLFTGFLRGDEVDRVLEAADCFVMPSVSEPFGIAALEAASHGVPVVVSRDAGAGEVLSNALSIDPSNPEDIAEKVIAVLRHPALRRTLREQSAGEIRGLSWDEAARRCVEVYRRAGAGVGADALTASAASPPR